MVSRIEFFVGGPTGKWQVERISPLRGSALIPAPRLAILGVIDPHYPIESVWLLRGVTSYERNVSRAEGLWRSGKAILSSGQ
jgi:hypothetical protein